MRRVTACPLDAGGQSDARDVRGGALAEEGVGGPRGELPVVADDGARSLSLCPSLSLPPPCGEEAGIRGGDVRCRLEQWIVQLREEEHASGAEEDAHGRPPEAELDSPLDMIADGARRRDHDIVAQFVDNDCSPVVED
jgi:hypothetical protein